MIWPPERIADFGQQAGFGGEVLVQAVALALTVSGGDDHWEWVGASPGVVVAAGLYGLAPAFVPGYDVADLFDPRTNSQLAHRLWKAADESFSWSKSFGTAAYAGNVGTARTVAQRLGRSVPASSSEPSAAVPGLAKAVAQGGRAAVAFLGDAATALRRLT